MLRAEPSRLAGLIRGFRSAGPAAEPAKAGQPRIESFALIIGAMKAGTTSLFDALASHPAIAPCRVKEPNFFGSARWKGGRAWYERQWPDFDPARHAWALEGSTHYAKGSQHPRAAERIAAFDARVKLLYLLRDPVDRIESHVAHNIAKGRRGADRRTLLDNAVQVSRYAHQLGRFREAFGGRPDILLLDFDELRDHPGALLRRCTDFLGIDPDFAFPARPPSNPRQATNGSEAFRLSAGERAAFREALRDDMLRLRDEWGVDVAKWGFAEAASAPVPKAPAVPAPKAAAAPDAPSEPAPEIAAMPAPATPAGSERRGNYWARRQDMMYYNYIRALALPLATEARSLIDVGSHQTSIAEEFDWIPDRVALDLRPPYSSEKVRGIQADFFRYEPERRYDFALCLQVLEHVPEAEAFARKLLAVADRVLVSVPYKWPKGRCVYHCQDPVDEAKLAGWFGRVPDYSLVVEEPFRDSAIGRRLIAYFHRPGERFDRERYRGRAAA